MERLEIKRQGLSTPPAVATDLPAIELCRRGYVPLGEVTLIQRSDEEHVFDTMTSLLHWSGRYDANMVQTIWADRPDSEPAAGCSGGFKVTWRSSDGINAYGRKRRPPRGRGGVSVPARSSRARIWKYLPGEIRRGEDLIRRTFPDTLHPDSQALIHAYRNYKLGFMDRDGRVVIPAQFEAAWPFSCGLAKIRVRGKLGFIDPTGKMVISPRFDSASCFSEGMAWVRMDVKERRKFGFIDPTGRLGIPPRYDFVRPFSEGLAVVRVGREEIYGYIDKQGSWILDQEYATASSFSEGRAAVQIPFQEHHFIDRSGKVVLGRFWGAGSFSEGLASVILPKHGENRVYIDESGKVMIHQMHGMEQMSRGDEFSGGRARLWYSETGMWGSFDRKGRIAFKPAYHSLGRFSDGLAWMLMDGKIGFLHRNGKFAISPQFQQASAFAEGRARVMIDNKIGFIDRNGHRIISARHLGAESFGGGLAVFGTDGHP